MAADGSGTSKSIGPGSKASEAPPVAGVTPAAVGKGSGSVLLAFAVMLGFLGAGLALGIGFGRVPAAGFGVIVLGLSLWLGSMRPNPATLPRDERTRRQNHRSLAIALGLGALVAIFYVATLVRLGPNALRKETPPGAGKTIPITDPVVCKKAGTC